MSRMPASRIATIGAWTAAAVAWGTTNVVMKTASAEPEQTESPTSTTLEIPSTTQAALPAQPEGGLVVLRFTPVTAPPPEVIVQTKYVSVGSRTPSGGGSRKSATPSAPSAPSDGAPVTKPPPPPPATTPATTPPAPPSSGS
jgi:hypothetical protein